MVVGNSVPQSAASNRGPGLEPWAPSKTSKDARTTREGRVRQMHEREKSLRQSEAHFHCFVQASRANPLCPASICENAPLVRPCCGKKGRANASVLLSNGRRVVSLVWCAWGEVRGCRPIYCCIAYLSASTLYGAATKYAIESLPQKTSKATRLVCNRTLQILSRRAVAMSW